MKNIEMKNEILKQSNTGLETTSLSSSEKRKLGRNVGLFYMGVIVFGIFAEVVRINTLSNAAISATSSIRNSEMMYRLALLSDLLMVLCFLYVGLTLYQIFSDVNQKNARHMLIFVTLSVAILTTNLINHYAPLYIVNNPDIFTDFSAGQIDGLIVMFVKLHGLGYTVAQIFFGLWLIPLGLLILESKYIPKTIGKLVIIAGLSHLLDMTLIILVPEITHITSNILALPAIIGEFSFAIWILIRGIKITKEQNSL